MSYNKANLPSSNHYLIDILYSEEFKRDVYFAVNKDTKVPELPFCLYSDSKQVLDDLEENYHKDGLTAIQGGVH